MRKLISSTKLLIAGKIEFFCYKKVPNCLVKVVTCVMKLPSRLKKKF